MIRGSICFETVLENRSCAVNAGCDGVLMLMLTLIRHERSPGCPAAPRQASVMGSRDGSTDVSLRSRFGVMRHYYSVDAMSHSVWQAGLTLHRSPVLFFNKTLRTTELERVRGRKQR